MNWEDLRYFGAVAREGSLTAAARSLKVNPATIGRHIDSLEHHLATRLFIREKTGYTLTGSGEKLLAHTDVIEMEVFALNRTMSAEDRELAGTTTVTTTEAMAGPFMVRNLPLLKQKYPNIVIQLIKEYRSLNLSRREADLAIRLMRPVQGDLKIRRIGTLGFGFYASPAYLKAMGEPTQISELRHHQVIDWLDDYSHLAPCTWFRKAIDPKKVTIKTNSAIERFAAAELDLGIMLGPCVMASRQRNVRRILTDDIVPSLELWLAVHADLASVARVRAVSEFIAEQAEINRDVLAGTATTARAP